MGEGAVGIGVRRFAALALALALGAAVGAAAAQEGRGEYDHVAMADGHLHIVDFFQDGDFFENGRFVRGNSGRDPGRPGARLDALIRMMDRADVTDAMISGMPMTKKWSANDPVRGRYYLDNDSRVMVAPETDVLVAEAWLDLGRMTGCAEAQSRLHPFLCGFDATDLNAVDHAVKMIKRYPGVWKGIGEAMSRHDDLTNLTPDERPRADHPGLMRIYDLAGELGLPVLLHHNIAPVSPSGAFRAPTYLPELERALEAHPRTTFVLAHAGVSRRIVTRDLPATLDGLLERHGDHLLIDISWVVFDDYVMKDLEVWTALMAKRPGNFLIGTDLTGSYRGYVSAIRSFDRLFAAMSDEALVRKVARENFLRILPSEGARLPLDYRYPEDRFTGD